MDPQMDDEANPNAEINNPIEIIVVDDDGEKIVEKQTENNESNETNENSSIISSPETRTENKITKIKLVLYTGIGKEVNGGTETGGNVSSFEGQSKNVTETDMDTNTGTKETKENIHSEKSITESISNVDVDMENDSNSVASEAELNKSIESEKHEQIVEIQSDKEIESKKLEKTVETETEKEIESEKHEKTFESEKHENTFETQTEKEIESEKHEKTFETQTEKEIESEKHEKAFETQTEKEIESEKHEKTVGTLSEREIESEKYEKTVETETEKEIESEKLDKTVETKPDEKIELEEHEKTVGAQQVEENETEENTAVAAEPCIEAGRKICSREETDKENESKEDTEMGKNLNKYDSTKETETEMKGKVEEKIEDNQKTVKIQIKTETDKTKEVDESSQLMNQSVTNPEGNEDSQEVEFVREIPLHVHQEELAEQNEERFANIKSSLDIENFSSVLKMIIHRNKLFSILYGENYSINYENSRRSQIDEEAYIKKENKYIAKTTKETDKGEIRNETITQNTASTSRQTEQIQTEEINARGTAKTGKTITETERERGIQLFGKRKNESTETRSVKRRVSTVEETIVLLSDDEDEPMITDEYKRSDEEPVKTEPTAEAEDSTVSSMKEQHMDDITARASCSSLDMMPKCTEPSWRNAHEGPIVIDSSDDQDDD